MWYRLCTQLMDDNLVFEIEEYNEEDEKINDPDLNGHGSIAAFLKHYPNPLGGATFSYSNAEPYLESIGVNQPFNGVGGAMVRALLNYWADHDMDFAHIGWNASPQARAMLQSLRNRGYQVESNIPESKWRTQEQWDEVSKPSGVDTSRIDQDLALTPYESTGALFEVSTRPVN